MPTTTHPLRGGPLPHGRHARQDVRSAAPSIQPREKAQPPSECTCTNWPRSGKLCDRCHLVWNDRRHVRAHLAEDRYVQRIEGLAMPTTAKSPLESVLNVRVTAMERDAVVAQARACGLTVSSYCRSLILGRVVTSRADLSVVNELRRLGGLLKHIHNESRGAYSADTAAALADVRRAISRIASGAKK